MRFQLTAGNVCNQWYKFWGGQWHIYFTLPASMTSFQLPNAVWIKPLRLPRVYDEYVLKTASGEGLPTSIRHSKHTFQSSHEGALLQKLVYEVTFQPALQAAVTRLDYLETQALKIKMSENRQQTYRGRTVDHTNTSSCGKLAQGHIHRLGENTEIQSARASVMQHSAFGFTKFWLNIVDRQHTIL